VSGLNSGANTQEPMRHGSFAGKLTNPPQICLQDGRTRVVEEITGGHQEQLLATRTGGGGQELQRWMCSSLTGKWPSGEHSSSAANRELGCHGKRL